MLVTAATNSIDRVVAKFSNDPVWNNGPFLPIFMPSNTPPIQVANQTLKNDDPLAARNFAVIEVRQIGICRAYEPTPEEYARLDPKMAGDLRAYYARTNYTVVAFWTSLGERIVMMQFLPLEDPRDRPGFWWSRAYDPTRLFPLKSRAGERK
jgi:hypothetical protein